MALSKLSRSVAGKVVIVTGAASGMGRATARLFADEGASVALIDVNEEPLQAVLGEIRDAGYNAEAWTLDLLDRAAIGPTVDAIAAHFGSIDILINNAGISIRKQPQDLSDDDWDQVLNTNLKSVFRLSKLMYSHFETIGHGKIINIGSMYSIFGSDWVVPYSASKGAVIQLTKSLAVAWAGKNIQVNAIIPGWFETELTSSIPTLDPKRYEKISNRIPAGKWGIPGDIAGTAVFLCSAASDYVTGTSVIVDGGYSAS